MSVKALVNMEEWRDIKGFESYYQVSNTGRVRNKLGLILKRRIWNRRDKVRLSINDVPCQKYVHRLVAEAFIPNPLGLPQVNHIDGDPTNNNVANLEWCTRSHNMQHAHNNNLIVMRKGASHHKAILDETQVLTIRSLRKDGVGPSTMARYFKCRQQTISEICLGHLWKHLAA